jgi:hypothetical protein
MATKSEAEVGYETSRDIWSMAGRQVTPRQAAGH